ncbi:protein-disulfide reductase DsbD N-terminal domain-containing protein (plasmid) [Xanthomonas citri pv. citri]|uniref:protein-disulfide reductase DsbD N-terminal domain-containing protein n=1 Tax=Xanthomonas citri TaxID=346 RepID=UPI00193460E6|nr:protein-disulfide reductase DsbD N-terminal domain-containing protein [Xanthomonas citri]QRD62758.1 protein-disulfide reductase DsbD N-terminal domain-containing protein [Xanthomonas citri pv. citri]QRD67085.1 protein-disulfide reductase DsbD N-terminal domain-containing protein [Xanthomonas citri pv. citri]QRD71662.1 protein-disulfide reductase DsbD N-terminal domain-containing protein [Xanthomonas citri pv. citri]
MKRPTLALCLLLPLVIGTVASEPLPSALAFRTSLERADAGTLVVDFDIAPGYFLYKKRLAVLDVQGFEVQDVVVTGVKQARDPVFGVEEVLDSGSHVLMRGRSISPSAPAAVRIKIQGCLINELCYPPEVRDLVAH